MAEQCEVTCKDFPMCLCEQAHRCVLDAGHPFDPMYGDIHEFVTHQTDVKPRRASVAGPQGDALAELFTLFEKDERGRWCFKSLSRDGSKLDRVMNRLATVAPSTTPAGEVSAAPVVDEDSPERHAKTCDRWVQCGDHEHYESVVNCTCAAAPLATPVGDDHRCPECGRRMQSDFDEDVGMWYECHECDFREAVSNAAPHVSDAARRAAEEIDKLLSVRLPPDVYIKFTPANQEIAAVISKQYLSKWLPIETAPKDEPLWLAGPSLVDEDYNRKGVVEGYWLDDLGWMGAIWNNEQDYWESKQINPTHWMPIPAAPRTDVEDLVSLAAAPADNDDQ